MESDVQTPQAGQGSLRGEWAGEGRDLGGGCGLSAGRGVRAWV